MRLIHVRRRGPMSALVIGACVALLAGCTSSLTGTPAPDQDVLPPPGKWLGYTPSDFDITYAGDDTADQIARDALDDVIAYYGSFYPEVFGHEFRPPTGGYFSIEPGEGHSSGCMDGPDDPFIEENAFYCARDDEIAYWRPLLQRYADDESDMQVALVLAHEMAHAVQAREGMFDVRSIVAETQADCFAGVWARGVADGDNPHFRFDPADLDETLLTWALELPSEVGSDPDAEGQHGSAFDRVTALQEGYVQGPTACRDDFGDDRVFTQAVFQGKDLASADPGDASYDDALGYAEQVFSDFYAARLPELGGAWAAPAVEIGAGADPACLVAEAVSYCEASNTVVVSDESALQALHDRYGDFAMMTALGLAYGTAAIVQLGYSTGDPQAMPAASCLTGAVAAALASGIDGISLSPGDFDEATVLLLSADEDNGIVDTGGVTAFERMNAFRAGVARGPGSCGITR